MRGVGSERRKRRKASVCNRLSITIYGLLWLSRETGGSTCLISHKHLTPSALEWLEDRDLDSRVVQPSCGLHSSAPLDLQGLAAASILVCLWGHTGWLPCCTDA